MKATLSFPATLLLQAQGGAFGMKAAIFDVDGVLTDGRIYVGEQGEPFKAFSTLDGHGLKLLKAGGIEPIVITGRDAPALRKRLSDLGVQHAHYGVHDKLACAEPLLASLGLQWGQVAAMGDDWPDLPLLVRAGLGIAPPGAHAELKAFAQAKGYVTQTPAGYGAVREACDLLLIAAGQYQRLFEQHLKTLDGA